MFDCIRNIDVVALANGLGSRSSNVLNDKPKLLTPMGERAYLIFLLAWLKNFNAPRVILILGHLAGTVGGLRSG